MEGRSIIAKGLLVAGLAGAGAYCLRAGTMTGAYNPAGPILIGMGTFLGVAALIGFVVFFMRGRL